MYKKQDKKMIIMDILDILKRHSDGNHRLKQDDILKYLQNEYLMEVDRRAVANNLDRLIEEDEYDINYTESVRGTGKNRNVMKTDFYINHEFDESELRLIIDSLLFSKYIPNSQCKNLIKKIESLASEHFTNKVRHIKTLPDTMTRNAEIFTTIEVIDEALEKGKKIKFNYCSYNLDKKLIVKKNEKGVAKEYIVTPIQMVATNSRYYLLCHMSGKDNIGIYRMDRIINADVLIEPAINKRDIKELKNGFDFPKHMMEHLYMNIGESDNVSFEFDKSVLDDVIDWFGKEVVIKKKDERIMVGTTKVNLKAMKFWAMQYGEVVKVISPKKLVSELKEMSANVAKKYK